MEQLKFHEKISKTVKSRFKNRSHLGSFWNARILAVSECYPVTSYEVLSIPKTLTNRGGYGNITFFPCLHREEFQGISWNLSTNAVKFWPLLIFKVIKTSQYFYLKVNKVVSIVCFRAIITRPWHVLIRSLVLIKPWRSLGKWVQ
jgi:hypothetical protein